MHIILGGTGHVGSEVAQRLLKDGQPVTIVTHTPSKVQQWRDRGAEVAIADVRDSAALRRVFTRGTRLFLLNPPADPSSDTQREERLTVDSIVEAIAGSTLQRIVAQSTYGARPGDRLGDLNVLYEMEKALAKQSVPYGIIRAAYYMSNWDGALETARNEGVVHSLIPASQKIPMVAPADLGRAAAHMLTQPLSNGSLLHVEGPEHYSPGEVAEAFAEALQKPVRVETVPRPQWATMFEGLGFSREAAESYARMTATLVDGAIEQPQSPERGTTTLRAYIRGLVETQ